MVDGIVAGKSQDIPRIVKTMQRTSLTALGTKSKRQ